MICPICHSSPCRWTRGTLGDVDWLTVDDWRDIYHFMRYVQLPFIHAVMARHMEGEMTKRKVLPKVTPIYEDVDWKAEAQKEFQKRALAEARFGHG